MSYTEDQIKEMFAAASREENPWKKAARFREARAALKTLDALTPGEKHRRKLAARLAVTQPKPSVAPKIDKPPAPQRVPVVPAISFPRLATIEQKLEICVKRCSSAVASQIMAARTSLSEKLCYRGDH